MDKSSDAPTEETVYSHLRHIKAMTEVAIERFDEFARAGTNESEGEQVDLAYVLAAITGCAMEAQSLLHLEGKDGNVEQVRGRATFRDSIRQLNSQKPEGHRDEVI